MDNRLPFFPVPYEDELFRSVLGRYHVRSGNRSDRETNLELFGRRNKKDYSLYGNSYMIRDVVNSAPEGWGTIQDIVLHHTLAPLLFRFNQERYDKFLKTGHYQSFISKDKVPCLRFCPLCIKEDEERYGECYWHVHHQIPGNTCCHKHHVRLLDSSVSTSGIHSNYALPSSTWSSCASEPVSEFEIRMCDLLWHFLYDEIEPADLLGKLCKALVSRGYYRKALNVSGLRGDLVSYYGSETADKIFPSGSKSLQCFEKLMKGTWVSHIQYAYLMMFLGIDADDEFSYKMAKLSSAGYSFDKDFLKAYLNCDDVLLKRIVSASESELVQRKGNGRQTHKISIMVSEDEFAEWNSLSEKMHTANLTEMLRFFIKRGIEDYLPVDF